jgi:hypothetical protein
LEERRSGSCSGAFAGERIAGENEDAKGRSRVGGRLFKTWRDDRRTNAV